MPFFEAVRLALISIRSQKLKSFFSLVGVMIGVTFLIAVVSIVQGMNVYMTDKFAGALIGINTFQLRSRPNIVMGNVTEEMWREWSRRERITVDDAEYLRENMKTPVVTAREGYDRMVIRWDGRQASDINVHTVDASYFQIKGWGIAEGRAFAPQEVRVGSSVAVLGSAVAEGLFQGRDPLGERIAVGGLPYRVIGVVEEQGTLFGMSLDKFIVTPLTSPVRRLVNRPRIIDDFHIQAVDPTMMSAAIEEVNTLMRVRRGLRPSEENNFHLETAEAALSEWGKISRVLFMALPGLVAISLVVGGIALAIYVAFIASGVIGR